MILSIVSLVPCESAHQSTQRPCSPVWKRFLQFLTSMRNLFVGWGTAQDQIVMQNHFGYEFIRDMRQRQFVSRTDPNCEQLDHQVQLIDMQKVVEPTWVPSMAGYDTRDQNQKGYPMLIQLSNTAMTLLIMAAMPKFTAAALQEMIYMHNRGRGYTEPKLFLYHDQVREDVSKEMYLKYAGTKCDNKKRAMLRRGHGEWMNTRARAYTIQPN